MIESTTHQIFVTSKLRTKYPDYLTNSDNQKYVSVIAVYLFKDDTTTNGDNSAQIGFGTTAVTTPTGKIAIDTETGERVHVVKCGKITCLACGNTVVDNDGDGVEDSTGIKIVTSHYEDKTAIVTDGKCDICGAKITPLSSIETINTSEYVPPTPPEDTTPAETTFTAPQYCQFHADFVQDDECLEQYVCMANVPLYHKRKYKQYNNPRYFNVWFTDYKGTKININELDPKNQYHFVVELLLEY